MTKCLGVANWMGDGNWDKVAWGGVALLLIGAAIGFCAEPLSKRLFPAHPERATMVRIGGLIFALIGTAWALFLG